MNPFLSVVIPLYNEEKYIIECVKSVLNQSCKDLEIIIVDDGSIDKSAQVCNELSKYSERILFVSKYNLGVSDARNKGIEMANGKYIAFLDSDDTWIENIYTNNLKQEIFAKDNDLVCFGNIETKKNNKIIAITYPGFLNENKLGDYVVDRLYTHLGAFFYNKEFLFDYDLFFEAGKRYIEDSLFKRKACYLSKKPDSKQILLYNYRLNFHSALHTSKKQELSYNRYQTYKMLASFYKEQYINNNTDVDYINSQQGVLYVNCVTEYCGICKNYYDWKKEFIDNKTLNSIYSEVVINGLIFPKRTKEKLIKMCNHPKLYFYHNRINSYISSVRAMLFRIVTIKIMDL